MRIGLFYHKNSEAQKCVREVKEWLKDEHHDPVINRTQGIKLAITFGGDGTILHTANKIAERGMSLPMIRVNFGNVGFLTNVGPERIYERIKEFLNDKNYILVKKSRVRVLVNRCGVIKYSGDALNEAFIDRISVKATSFIVEDPFQDKEHSKTLLKGDGIIFSTKTGSTAYNRSAHGPILVKEDNMAMTMICPTTNPWSQVVCLNEFTRFKVSGFQKGNARLTLDGKMIMRLNPNDVVVVMKSDKDTIFVEFGDQI
jgi:NAD+ kinase